jgi:hypothetical protein
MHYAAAIIILAFTAQAQGDDVMDTMLDRATQASPLWDDLDGATLGKASSSLAVATPSSAKVLFRPPQRSLALRAAQFDTKSGQLGTTSSKTPSFPSAFSSKMSRTLPVANAVTMDPDVKEAVNPNEVRVTLDPATASKIPMKRVEYGQDGLKLMKVGNLKEDSEAYRRGMRPGMVVKALVGGFGKSENEVWEVTPMRVECLDIVAFADTVRRGSYPVTYVMEKGGVLGSTSTNDQNDLGNQLGEVAKWIDGLPQQTKIIACASVIPFALVGGLNAISPPQ